MSDQEETSAADAAERFAIGISFGNSNSSIAHTSSDGLPEVIANEEGDRQIPSVISYIGGDEFHGTQAKSQLVRNSKNTVAYFRDFLGKDFKAIDPTPCHASAHPVEHGDTVAFHVQEKPDESPSTLTVSEVTARHLRRLALSASEYLGKRVSAAVITIPTDFSDPQREALTKASEDAGIEVLQLIHEPVAAVLAYDARPEASVADKVIAVADLGGTRSDVAVVASRGGIYTILATAHDYSLGGAQLDQVLVDFCAKDFVKKHKTDPREKARGLAKLKLEAEAAKKALSLGTSANVTVESLVEGLDFSTTVNRTRYELLAARVFDGFTQLVERAVRQAELDVLEVDEVILSGGTSNTPKIARLLQFLFPASAVLSASTSTQSLNPSELAVRGAAIQASLVQEFDKDDIEQSCHPMVTVTQHLARTVGVVLVSADEPDAVFRPLLEAETAAPARRMAQIAAPRSGGDVLVRLCEGIREIQVTKAEPRSKAGRADKVKDGENDADADDDDDSDAGSVDEPEEVRQKTWKIGTILAEAAVRGVGKSTGKSKGKSGGDGIKKIEVTVNVSEDLGVQFTAREVGGKGGVRGQIERPRVEENGTA